MTLPAARGRRGSAISGIATAQTVLDIYQGRSRLALIRDIAMGEWTVQEIAGQLGLPASEIATFSAMFADEISEVRAALAGRLAIDTAGLWVSKRYNRVAEYQNQIEQLEEDIAAARKRFGPGSREHINVVRTWAILMSKVADEYLPTRIDRADADNGKVVRYVIEADDYIAGGLS